MTETGDSVSPLMSGIRTLNRHTSVSKRTRYIESNNTRNRRCPACRRGMAMVQAADGRFCRWCGFDPHQHTVKPDGGYEWSPFGDDAAETGGNLQ